MPVAGGAEVLTEALRLLDAASIGLDDVGLRRPTLDDVFLSLTGHATEQDEDESRQGQGRSTRVSIPYVFADAAVVAKRNLIKIKRVPDLLVFTTIQPIMFVLLFSFVFGGAIGGGNGQSYREFLMAGIFAQTVIFGATITGAGLADDVKKGIIDRFRSLPMAPSAVLTGRTVSDVLNNVLVLIVMSLTGLLVGWRIHTNAAEAIGGFAAPARLRLRDLLDHGVDRHARAEPRGGQQRGVHRDLPASRSSPTPSCRSTRCRPSCRRSRRGTRSRP